MDAEMITKGGKTFEIPHCPKCGEPLRSIVELPDAIVQAFGRERFMAVHVPCLCEREAEEKRKRRERDLEDTRRIDRLREASLMDKLYQDMTFKNAVTTKQNEKNLQLCKRYAERFDEMVEKDQGLLLWGEVGTGKSHAAACIANHLLDRGVPVLMTSFIKLVNTMERRGQEQTISLLERAKLVIFDDLGAERSTDYVIEKVYNIVDSRVRSKLPMVLTTNLTLEQMQGERDVRLQRIYDRVFDTCYPLQFVGNSWRKKAASKRFAEMQVLLEGE